MSSPFLKIEGLDDFLLKFKSLRALDLSCTVIGQLPASIGNLKHLQYLSVNNTDIRRLPSELCLLENLQTLEVRNCHQLVTLPEGTKNLAKLIYLDVRKQPGHVRMPIGVGELIHLQSLPVLNVGEGLSDCSIQELRYLDNLHGDLAITGLENIKVGTDAKEAKLIKKKHLETLTLEWSDNSIYFEEEDEDISVEVFESLEPPRDLVNLIVRNYCSSLFPVWIEKSPFDNLQSITLDNCYNCYLLPALGDLQSLRYLCLRKMYALNFFGYNPSLPEKGSCGKFPALEILKLWEMYELEGWIGVKDGDFPRLHNVSICGCPTLKSLPRLPSLVDLSFYHCNQLPEIPELRKLESLKIECFQDMMSLDLPQGLPALKNRKAQLDVGTAAARCWRGGRGLPQAVWFVRDQATNRPTHTVVTVLHPTRLGLPPRRPSCPQSSLPSIRPVAGGFEQPPHPR
uniref:R13L1/DRL21-like LRR repeat region domain-containing protein n=1 Tax=Arundo donax TaxID=35708 RepID=A0A0A9DLC8_ARUDO